MILPEVTPRPGVSKKRSRQQQQSRQRQGSSKRWTLSLTEIPRMLPAAMVMLLSAVPGGSSSSTLSSFFTSALADPASSANLFQNLADDSPLARTMTGCRQVTPSEEASEDRYSVSSPGADPLKLSHGTTTVALVCAGGVVAAVDSRASMGSFVGSRTTQKVCWRVLQLELAVPGYSYLRMFISRWYASSCASRLKSISSVRTWSFSLRTSSIPVKNIEPRSHLWKFYCHSRLRASTFFRR